MTFHSLHLHSSMAFSIPSASVTILQPVRNNDKIISIDMKMAWWGLEHIDERQGTEYRTLVDPDLHLKLMSVTLASTNRTFHTSTPSFRSNHQITFLETRSNAFHRHKKVMLSRLFTARYFSCSCWTTIITPVSASFWDKSELGLGCCPF